jgi:hypothetical protein
VINLLSPLGHDFRENRLARFGGPGPAQEIPAVQAGGACWDVARVELKESVLTEPDQAGMKAQRGILKHLAGDFPRDLPNPPVTIRATT